MNFSCSSRKNNQIYRFAVIEIPEKINPYTNQANINNIIFQNLYYPMFEKQKNDLTSVYFDMNRTKALNEEFTKYQFCLNDNIKFSNNDPVEITDVLESLKAIHNHNINLSKIINLKKSNNCLILDLERREFNYFDKLTGLTSVVVQFKSISNEPNAPVGYGPYCIDLWTNNIIKLKTCSNIKNRDVSIVEFVRFTNFSDSENKKVNDYNQLFQIPIPESIKSRMQVIERPTMKTYNLLVKVNNESLRKVIAACLNPAEIASYIQIALKQIPGFLPEGSAGFNVEYSKYRSRLKCKNRIIPSLNFYVINSDIIESLQNYFTNNQNRMLRNINVKSISPKNLLEILTKSGHDNFIALIGFDNSGTQASSDFDSTGFFEVFIKNEREQRFIDKPLENVKSIIEIANSYDISDAKKNNLITKAHEELLNSGYIAPLGQYISKQYYEKWISNIIWNERISGYPRVQDMKVN